MSDMQWRKANGDLGEYDGPLVDLGQGIPRRMGDHGFRRAMYDLAFGYVSGFPLRDILAFSWRSLFPQSILPIELAESVEESYVGSVWIMCPECHDLVPARVKAAIEDPDAAHLGAARLVCTPDMTDVHAHAWTHLS